MGRERFCSHPPKFEGVQYKVYNIGNINHDKLMVFIWGLEKALSNILDREVEFEKVYELIKAGDVSKAYASIDRLYEAVECE